jgi:hypothetical protein
VTAVAALDEQVVEEHARTVASRAGRIDVPFNLISRGGVAGDLVGLPNSQLAVLPGTTHVGLVDRAEWLLSMIPPFLDAPMPERK